MAERNPRTSTRGFSLVELMIAVLFTMILMAGMAAVFRSTLTTFTATGEKLSAARRNRMSLDLLYDDLNNAGMYLTDLSTPPALSTANEAFYVLPDPKANAGTPIPGVTGGADELYFYMDEPLPFEGTLKSSTAKTAAELVASGSAAGSADFTYTVNCGDATYAKQVTKGMVFIFKDSWETGYISSDPTTSTTDVTIVTGSDPTSAVTGRGSAGLPAKFQHIKGSSGTGIVFIRPAQMVRYSLQALKLDPQNSAGTTLCLVRDQGTYSTAGFTADQPQQIVTENVVGFRVYVSTDSGRNWVGGAGYTDWAGIKAGINSQLVNSGRDGYTSLGSDLNWFRSTPVLVRVDVTTRTATQRAEYSATGKTLAYQENLQSVVMVPRHSGLTMN